MMFKRSLICRDTERNKEIAFLESQIYEYVETLGVSEDGWMCLCLNSLPVDFTAYDTVL